VGGGGVRRGQNSSLCPAVRGFSTAKMRKPVPAANPRKQRRVTRRLFKDGGGGDRKPSSFPGERQPSYEADRTAGTSPKGKEPGVNVPTQDEKVYLGEKLERAASTGPRYRFCSRLENTQGEWELETIND